MTMLEDLRECPFCGSAAVLHHPTNQRMRGITYVLCDGCGAVTSFRPNLSGSKCVAAWNNRTHAEQIERDARDARLFRLLFPDEAGRELARKTLEAVKS